MEEYIVKMTTSAIAQVSDIISYISSTLLVPDTALKWSNRLQKEIADLNRMPARYTLVDEEPWRGLGIHKMPIKNFIVYFWIDETAKIVWVTAVIYARRDQLNHLKEMPL